ncbi:MAG: hypothetical protein IKH88_03695 [Prevotella sp.]|nr:hypothetical protein [Prevotella sp.]
MKIYTSYFDNWKALVAHKVIIVSVTIRRPWGFTDMPVLSSLAPNMVCKNAPPNKFLETYRKEVLGKSNPYMVYETLKTISVTNNNADIALCDFSKPSNYNYRRQIALWMQQYLDIRIEEFPIQPNPTDFKINEKKTGTGEIG